MWLRNGGGVKEEGLMGEEWGWDVGLGGGGRYTAHNRISGKYIYIYFSTHKRQIYFFSDTKRFHCNIDTSGGKKEEEKNTDLLDNIKSIRFADPSLAPTRSEVNRERGSPRKVRSNRTDLT